nr:unnamed protein product [Digitaria exilis]
MHLDILVSYFREPEMRSAASDLLQAVRFQFSIEQVLWLLNRDLSRPGKLRNLNSYKSSGTRPLWDLHSNGDDMCQFADNDDVPMVGASFNPMCEPSDEWESKLDISPAQRLSQSREFGGLAKLAESQMSEKDFTFPCEGSCEEDDEFTESRIKEFLDEKVFVILSFSEVQKKWKEELDQELKREREMRSSGYGKASSPSPKSRRLTGKRDRSPVY